MGFRSGEYGGRYRISQPASSIRWRVCAVFVKRGVVPHDHAAAQQTGQQLLLKPSVEHLGVATAHKEHGSDQFAGAISP